MIMKKININVVKVHKIVPKLPGTEAAKSAYVASTGALRVTHKSPDLALGPLFQDVQAAQVFSDGKTFVDLVPKKRARAIAREYAVEKRDPNFNLSEFVNRHFYEFSPYDKTYKSDASVDVQAHIHNLWTVLERRNRRDRGSLIALPQKYVVPGGRFSEQFYWDSYFIMLGLAADKRWDMIEHMMDNYGYMIRKYGYIPTANRTYFLSRSQPPFFALMVQLLSQKHGKLQTYSTYLPYMLSEYKFWMKGSRLVSEKKPAYARLVHMPDGSLLNRYYDNRSTPRPESAREDIETASRATSGGKRDAHQEEPEKLYLDLRAGAESGWDFSSRWFRESGNIASIHTTDIIPIDLNSLLYTLEQTIAESYRILKQPLLARKFEGFAAARKVAILKYCWDEAKQIFCDYDFVAERSTNRVTLAASFALFAGIATESQAKETAKWLKSAFLKRGGLQTTLDDNGQQWDSPNGWAPLQWVSIQGLRRYKYNDLADTIKHRWVSTCLSVYKKHHKLVEKYDVVGTDGLGGGGEYPLQDGFGWTNGVLLALLREADAS
jgi:alpha,alpha-trehalase